MKEPYVVCSISKELDGTFKVFKGEPTRTTLLAEELHNYLKALEAIVDTVVYNVGHGAVGYSVADFLEVLPLAITTNHSLLFKDELPKH